MATPAPAPGLLENLKLNIPAISNLQANLQANKDLQVIDQAAVKLIDQLPIVMVSVLAGLALIVVGWLACGWLATRLNTVLVKAHVEETLAAFLASTARFVLFFTIFMLALSLFGIGSTTLAALVGALGLAVAFALRGTLGNIAGGLMLMVHRPLKVGDWVENTTVSGTVKRIGLFSTEVNTIEFIRVFIPNGLLWENNLRNHTYNRMRMVKVEFGLGHEVDIWRAFGIIKRAMVANPLVLKTPEPHLAVDTLTEHGVMCTLEAWVRTEDRKVLRSTLLLDVMDALREEDIRMAYQDKKPAKAPASEAQRLKRERKGSKAGAPVAKAGKVTPKPKG